MKYLAFILILAAVFCGNSIKSKENGVIDVIKCILEKSGPLTEDIINIVEAIQKKDYLELVSLIVKAIQDGKTFISECFPTHRFGTVSLDKEFCECLIKYGGKDYEVIMAIIQDILTGDFWEAFWILENVYKTATKEGEIVRKCCQECDK